MYDQQLPPVRNSMLWPLERRCPHTIMAAMQRLCLQDVTQDGSFLLLFRVKALIDDCYRCRAFWHHSTSLSAAQISNDLALLQGCWSKQLRKQSLHFSLWNLCISESVPLRLHRAAPVGCVDELAFFFLRTRLPGCVAAAVSQCNQAFSQCSAETCFNGSRFFRTFSVFFLNIF